MARRKRREIPFDVSEHFHGAVTVGARGQVVIPAGVRERMGIEPGDKLLVFSHPGGVGILLMPVEHAGMVVELLRQLVEAEGGERK